LAKSQWSFKTAVELSAALAAKKVSAVELAEDAIGRIERHDAKINASVFANSSAALRRARAADAELARGGEEAAARPARDVQESYNIAGLPTTWGIPAQKDFTPTEARVAGLAGQGRRRRHPRQDQRPLGLADWQSYNEIYGTTNNPFDLAARRAAPPAVHRRRSPRAMGPLSLGSDIGPPCACRRFIAASTRTSQRSTSSPCAATRRRPCRRCLRRAISA
jgi:amidase